MTGMTTHPWIQVAPSHLVWIRLPPERTDAALKTMLAALERVERRCPAPYGLIVDLRQIRKSTARRRRMVADYDRCIMENRQQRCAGVAVLLMSGFARGLYTSVRWLQPVPYDELVTWSHREAESWLRQRLGKSSERRGQVGLPGSFTASCRV